MAGDGEGALVGGEGVSGPLIERGVSEAEEGIIQDMKIFFAGVRAAAQLLGGFDGMALGFGSFTGVSTGGEHIAFLQSGGGENAQRFAAGRVLLTHGAGDPERFGEAVESGVRVSQVGAARIALHLGDAQVRIGEFLIESGIVAGLAGEAVEIFEGGLDDEFAGFGGSLEVLDLIVKGEEEGVGELSNLEEAAIGAAGLEKGDADAGEQTEEDEGGCSRPNAVAADEFSGEVPDRILARGDREAREVAADVLGEGFDGRVAALALLAEGSEDNVVEITLERAAQRGFGAGGGVAGTVRLRLAHGFGDVSGRVILELVSLLAGEQFK
ncbi:MAG: hypothetical protein IANPNBLG_00303 [Bryobacteraceae bacterium]|nr:hypothetical protein [Bryobacteraceae bacterium]